jgi:hypothetical protein
VYFSICFDEYRYAICKRISRDFEPQVFGTRKLPDCTLQSRRARQRPYAAGIADYYALTATKRMRLYALLSTIAAAISALASALAAYFAYLSVRH